ncbi:MAG: hypothetical protein ACK4R7_00430 [Fervidobacterium sp.]
MKSTKTVKRKINFVSHVTNFLKFIEDYLKKLINILISFFLNLFKKRKIASQKKFYTVAIVHFTNDGNNNIRKLFSEFNIELRTADIIVGYNICQQDFLKFSISLKHKEYLFIPENVERIEQSGHSIAYINHFDVKKLKHLVKKGVKIIVTSDKQTAWMISQMFPFYCIVPSLPFQETFITAPIPLTRNSDGYYFTKVAYRNQVTIIDLNVDILSDFKNL